MANPARPLHPDRTRRPRRRHAAHGSLLPRPGAAARGRGRRARGEVRRRAPRSAPGHPPAPARAPAARGDPPPARNARRRAIVALAETEDTRPTTPPSTTSTVSWPPRVAAAGSRLLRAPGCRIARRHAPTPPPQPAVPAPDVPRRTRASSVPSGSGSSSVPTSNCTSVGRSRARRPNGSIGSSTIARDLLEEDPS